MNRLSPLEKLTAFSICFTAGALSVMASAAYIIFGKGKGKGKRRAP